MAGKITIKSLFQLNRKNLPKIYTPGVADESLAIYKNPEKVGALTAKSNMIAIVTDGSAVLGLGNLGPEAALPVMEGKSVLFKQLAGINAFPIILNTQKTHEIIATVKTISPSFSGINLEDISAPRCFEIEKKLSDQLDIPVFHDDQHGTAIAVLAGLINASKVSGVDIRKSKIVISGAGAAGIAIANLLLSYGARNIIVFDSKGALCNKRTAGLNIYKYEILKKTNPRNYCGRIENALKSAKIFIGVSVPGVLNREKVKLMEKKPIVFALSNPIPEIERKEAIAGGALIYASGRSDYPNQINNALVFPGIFLGALRSSKKKIDVSLKIKAAQKIAALVAKPRNDKIIPDILDRKVPEAVASAFVS